MKWLLFWPCFVIYFCCCPGYLGPVKNFTTITLYTDPHTWNEADTVCKLQGGRLLDITRYSLFSALFTLALESPWNTVPVGNGPVAWLGLHRRITPLGDRYYSEDCEPLEDFKISYWNTVDPYSIMDGDASSFCVHNYMPQSTSGTTTFIQHDYSRASCDEQHRFYCQTETGQCKFESVPGYHGDTSQDFSPGNDVIYTYVSDAICAELCLNTSTIFPHSDLLVIEECWGYTTTSTECYIHLVLKPSYFDTAANRMLSVWSTLYIKRCYASAVDSSVYNITSDPSQYPNTTCGIPETGLSSMTAREVFVYQGQLTWNNAYTICNMYGQNMLHITQQADYTSIQQIVNKYKDVIKMESIWLGLHEPDPVNHTDIRVWSDCTAGYTPNWDTNSLPSTNISDTNLCVTIETNTSLWYTDTCNTKHDVVCMGDFVTNRSYSLGQVNTTGSGNQLVYVVTETACRDMCSEWTYDNEECWGYSVKPAGTNIDTDCFLFFMNSSMETVPNNNFTFYYKLYWTDTFVNNSELVNLTVDMEILPKSCCNVSGLRSQCPENTYPTTDQNIPTTTKTVFTLHTTLATWNEANTICKSNGGRLLQVDDVTKRVMMLNYISDWVAKGIPLTNIWLGLAQIHTDDACSLRWTKDCTVPSWTDFSDTAYLDNTSERCVATDQTMKFTKRSCDTTLMFVCEADVGPCNFSNIVNVECNAGLKGKTYSLSSTTCMDLCRTQTYSNMECWAASMSGSTACDLFFHSDPTYCADNNAFKNRLDTVFKICYAASMDTSGVITSHDSLRTPNHTCDNGIPASLKVDVCNIESSITLTPSMSTSTVSPIVQYTLSVTQSTASSPVTTVNSASTASLLSSYMINSPSTTLTDTLNSPSAYSYSPNSSSNFLSTSYAITVWSSFVTTGSIAETSVSYSYSTVSTYPSTSNPLLTSYSTTVSPSLATTGSSAVPTSLSAVTNTLNSPTASSNSPMMTPSSLSTSITVSPSSATTSSNYVAALSIVTDILNPPAASSNSPTMTSDLLSTSTAMSPSFVTTGSGEDTSVPTSVTPSSLVTTSSSSIPMTSSNNSVVTPTSSSIMLASTSVITTQSTSLVTSNTSQAELSARPIFIVACLCCAECETRMTMEEWQEWFIRTNEVDIHNTSRYRRSHTSVYDGRTSTLTIGIIASTLIVGSAVYLITTDIPRILRDLILYRRDLYTRSRK